MDFEKWHVQKLEGELLPFVRQFGLGTLKDTWS